MHFAALPLGHHFTLQWGHWGGGGSSILSLSLCNLQAASGDWLEEVCVNNLELHFSCQPKAMFIETTAENGRWFRANAAAAPPLPEDGTSLAGENPAAATLDEKVIVL